MKKRALCLWLTDWSIQRRLAQRSMPEHAAITYEPSFLVIYTHPANRGCRVVTRSLEAARTGIMPGMPLAEARALCNQLDSSRFEEDDPIADRASLDRLAEWCQRFSPIVSIEESLRPESLHLDITGCSHLWGDEEGLARDLLSSLATWGLVGRIGIADTIGAAWGLAHFAPHPLTVVPAGQTVAALLSLPVAALRIPEDILTILAELGVARVEDLESLRRASLASRFDPRLLLRLDQALGRAREVVHPKEPPAEIEVSHLLEYPLVNRELLVEIVQLLLKQVIAQLRIGHGIVRFEISMKHQPPITATRLPVGLCRPSARLDHLVQLAHLSLERARLPAPVQEIRLRTAWTAPLEMISAELFDNDNERLLRLECDALIDRLTNRLGREYVLAVRLTADAQPERSCHYLPASDVSLSKRASKLPRERSSPSDAKQQRTPRRPVTMFDPPPRLEVKTLQPSGTPVSLQREGHEERIARAWGPERIQTGWWRGRPVHRDYYRVEMERGHRLWIFRNLADGGWFLHGAFE